MREEEVGIELFGDSFMVGELLAVVGRQRMNATPERRQQRDHRVGHVLCGLRRNVGDQGIAGSAFIDRHECLLMTGADDQICLPVAEPLAAVGNIGA